MFWGACFIGRVHSLYGHGCVNVAHEQNVGAFGDVVVSWLTAELICQPAGEDSKAKFGARAARTMMEQSVAENGRLVISEDKVCVFVCIGACLVWVCVRDERSV